MGVQWMSTSARCIEAASVCSFNGCAWITASVPWRKSLVSPPSSAFVHVQNGQFAQPGLPGQREGNRARGAAGPQHQYIARIDFHAAIRQGLQRARSIRAKSKQSISFMDHGIDRPDGTIDLVDVIHIFHDFDFMGNGHTQPAKITQRPYARQRTPDILHLARHVNEVQVQAVKGRIVNRG